MLDVQDIRGPAIAIGCLEAVDRALTFTEQGHVDGIRELFSSLRSER